MTLTMDKMKSQSEQIGGKGSVRRKRKVIHRTPTDDKKLQATLKKMATNPIPGIEEVNMFKDDGTILHFTNPKVQASLGANTFSVTGHAETKKLTEMLPSVLSQMGPEAFSKLGSSLNFMKPDASDPTADADVDDDIPELVENFEDASKDEDTKKTA